LQHGLAAAITFEPFVGDGRPDDVAAELLQFCTLIGAPAHRRMEAKAVRVDTQLWSGGPGRARQALQAQDLVARVGQALGEMAMKNQELRSKE